jgi:hypothetical protein
VSGKVMAVVTGLAIGAAAAPASAQTAPSVQEAARPVTRQSAAALRAQVDQLRYQIGTMERVLEHAVEYGASVWRDRMQALAPVQALLLDNARVRGYRLEGYGLFFDIDVPSLETTLLAAFRTLDQNGLGLQSAWNQIKASIQAQAANDANLQQAVKRLELQVVPGTPVATTADVTGLRLATGSAASTGEPAVPPPHADDPILANPEEAYRAEVMSAVLDAMLDYSGALGLTGDEWLTVGVRRNEIRPRIGLDNNAQTFIARVRGADLNAFRAGQMSREDAIRRVEMKVF